MKTIKILTVLFLLMAISSCQKEPIEVDLPINNELTSVNAKSDPRSNDCISIVDCPPFLTIKEHNPTDKPTGLAATAFKGALYAVSATEITKRDRTQHLTITKSYDGIIWNTISVLGGTSRSGNLRLVVFNNELWLAGITDGHPWDHAPFFKSSNGYLWERVEIPFAVGGHENVFVFQNRLYVTDTPGLSRLHYTENGTTWTEAYYQPSDRHHHWPQHMVVFKNHVYAFIYGGRGHGDDIDTPVEIWKSANGREWNKIRSRYPFMSPRSGFSVSSYKGKLWVIGGFYARSSGGTSTSVRNYNEIWYSDDAVNWKKYTGTNPIENIYNQWATVFKDKLWLFNGRLDPSVRLPTYELKHR